MSAVTAASRPFVVHAAKLRRSPGSRWHEVRRGPLGGLACRASAVPDDSEVEADVVLEAVSGAVAVTGTVRARWTGACGRCLAAAAGDLEVAVREHYSEGGDGEDMYPLHDGVVDLEPLVRDAVLLELPQSPLCRLDCRGLCPVCGADRNTEPCQCEPPRDDRWRALDALYPAGPGEGEETAGGGLT